MTQLSLFNTLTCIFEQVILTRTLPGHSDMHISIQNSHYRIVYEHLEFLNDYKKVLFINVLGKFWEIHIPKPHTPQRPEKRVH